MRNAGIRLDFTNVNGLSVKYLHCRFPVESMVSLPNGTVLSRMNANDLMEGPSNEELM